MTQIPEDVNAQLASKLKATLPSHIFDLLTSAAVQAENQGWQIYLVAGILRDSLLGLDVRDLDISVVGNALQIVEELARSSGFELEVFGQFGTATLKRPGEPDIDLVTARKESYPQPGALPIVEAGDIYDDLARRDFSVNAMAVQFTPGGFGMLLDPHDGIADLRARSIRLLHNQSFRDDPTRIFRAVKFARRLGFSIEKQTLELILQAVRDGALYTVSMDRITREIMLILEEPRADAMLWDLDRFGVLTSIHPLLSWPYEPGKIRSYQDELLTPEERRDTYLAVLGAELGPEPDEADNVAHWLSLPAPQAKLMRDAARLGKLWPQLSEEQSRWRIYNLLRELDVRALEAYARIEALRSDKTAWERLVLFLDTLRHIKPEIGGDYLESLGARPGPIYGEVLEQLLEAKVEGNVPTRADEEKFVREKLTQGE
ncbi:MAG: CCA tRNA nucleotidyltransferase [Chloroflexia bacterium]